MRSLMALAALSLLVGFLSFRSWWRRGVALLLCFPLVYLGNVVRVTAIVFAAQWAGPTWAGRVHDWFGFLVFVIVLGGVLAAVNAMLRWWPEKDSPVVGAVAPNRPEDAVTREEQSGQLRATAPTVIALSVAVLAVGEMLALRHVAGLPPRGAAGVRLTADEKNPTELPAFLGTEWIGRRAEVTAMERELLPEDTGFSRKLYVSLTSARRAVFLSVVLSGRDRSSIHRPELCLVGQGWSIASTADHRFDYPGRPAAGFPVKLLRVRREMTVPAIAGQPPRTIVVPQLVAYWFVGSDAVIATHWERLAQDAWNRVAHGRADRWAYVLVQTDADDGETAALARIQTVLKETLPAFQQPFDRP